jgi:hypothetical protein
LAKPWVEKPLSHDLQKTFTAILFRRHFLSAFNGGTNDDKVLNVQALSHTNSPMPTCRAEFHRGRMSSRCTEMAGPPDLRRAMDPIGCSHCPASSVTRRNTNLPGCCVSEKPHRGNSPDWVGIYLSFIQAMSALWVKERVNALTCTCAPLCQIVWPSQADSTLLPQELRDV